MIEWYQLVGLNILLIPVIMYLDFIFLKKHVKESIGREPEWYYFLPATTLELMMFNMGILIGVGYCG